MFVLLDTVTISEFRKMLAGNDSVMRWQEALNGAPVFLSVVTINELRYGLRLVERRDPVFGAKLQKWIEGILVRPRIFPLLSVDLAVAEQAADYRALLGLSYNDSFIAATARVHDLTLATRNVSDYEKTGIRLVNPWDFGK